MLRNYRAVFREPGTAAFCVAGLIMRLPLAMYALGLVLIVSARTGHYGFAGVLSACYVFGAVPGNPWLARLTDRHGQRAVMLPAIAVHAIAVAVLVVLFETDTPDWTLIAPAVVAGSSYISVGSLVRSRWSYVLAGRPELTTAYSLESTLDEVVFVLGPLVATFIATQFDPVLVLVVAGSLTSIGAVALAAQRRSEPPAHPPTAERHPLALRLRGMVLLPLMAVAMGALFAGAEVALVAYCGQHGHRPFSGAVLACFAGGSGVAGFVYGTITWRSSVLGRFRVHALIFAALPMLFLAAGDVPWLAVCAFVVGLGIAPTLITSFGLVERSVPAAALNEGMTWLTTGLNIGYGAAAALSGRLADAHGARTAFLVPIGAGLLMGALALAVHRRLSAVREPAVPVAA
ncbi:MAG: MFS transporter [Jatrophihabitans sp.]|uniref:MFS transporter n=1 Tax=Jatrophihabitans sp. TaxID=1932789 RepID=UPI003F7F7183